MDDNRRKTGSWDPEESIGQTVERDNDDDGSDDTSSRGPDS